MKPSVLIIDDDKLIGDVLATALTDEGYQVSLAHDGQDALDHINGYVPSVILLDLMMPRMTGAAFISELVRRGIRQNTSIIVLSAGAHLIEEAQKLAPDAVLAKPFELDDVLNTVAELTPADSTD